ncbi:MAG: DNA-formamidopyrimidine glycosylase [Parcubacteria group bacterium]|nr:DNA-formamidopyrimidine glycosylase [Parcubacteria group bacterium]
MPELPEVETITQDLRRKLIGWRIVDLWSDWPKYFKSSGGFNRAKRILIGRRITGLERLGKNILFYLSGGYALAVHLKMTGHFLFSPPPRPHYTHLIFDLKKGGQKSKLYFSDVRKFARILIGRKDVVMTRPEISKLGPDPLGLSLREFIARIEKCRGKIKAILLNQEILAGVGNIYSDEALYLAKINPLSRVEKIPLAQKKLLFNKLVSVLKKSLALKGSSRRDYRLPSGGKGDYYGARLVYARKGEKCACGGVVATLKIGSRTAHFCPKCQKLY